MGSQEKLLIMKALALACSIPLFLGIYSITPTDPLPPLPCPNCKSVSGSGPLTGEYYLMDTQETQCGDGCAYSRQGESGDRYCFVKEMGLYTSSECEETLPATEAPFMRVIKTVIEENGEIYEQVDSFNNETGEVSIEVPPHGDREPLKILLDPIGDTLATSTLSKCQIKSLPEGVNPHSVASSGDEVESRDEIITEDTEEVKHSITIEIGEASLDELDKLSPAAYSACGDKKVVLTEEKSVSGEVFENLTSGGIINVGSRSLRRKRDSHLANCTVTRMCGARTSGCWRWPYGTSFSIHHLNLDVLCVECCEEETSTSDLCVCSAITTLEQLEQCTKPDESSCPDGFYFCDGQCKVEVGAATEKCNGSCPESRVPCGDLCIPAEWSSNLYDHYKQWVDCNGQCQRGDTPCNGTCPDGKTACGDRCVWDSHLSSKWYRVCDGVCITVSTPCNRNCEDGSVLCGEVCRKDDGNWRSCNGQCIYKTEACDGTCPMGASLCGNSSRCIAPDDRSFKECNGECTPFLTPCDNVCPNGTVACGDECIHDQEVNHYRECNGKCVYSRDPCNGECPDRMIFCQHRQSEEMFDGPRKEGPSRTSHGEGYCIMDDGSSYKCGEQCLRKTQKCNGTCTEGWISCGQEDSGTDDYVYYEGNGQAECHKGEGSYHRECNGQCLPPYKPCNGECLDGWYPCNDWCNENKYRCNNLCPDGWEQCGGERDYRCMKDDSPYSHFRSCGDKCIGKYEACNDTCAEGMSVCGYENSWQDTLLCHTADSINRPCNGVCLINGTACDGQCPDGFTVCTLGYLNEGDTNQQVCYNDSDDSLFYFYNGYCWYNVNSGTMLH